MLISHRLTVPAGSERSSGTESCSRTNESRKDSKASITVHGTTVHGIHASSALHDPEHVVGVEDKEVLPVELYLGA